ncbi:MAG: low specificity L-threonine aldolase [Rikenellaceae bacterium]
MRSFASDNNSAVHPLIMESIIAANKDHAVGYGDDKWTSLATERIESLFGEYAKAFILFNGTGANSVAIQSLTNSYNSVLCASTAHIFVDECGAPQKMSGAAIMPIDTPDGKLTCELIKPHLTHFGEVHHSQPKVVYISQTTEYGTIYTLDQIKAIADLIHPYGMYLHMDGARIANACAALGCSIKEMTSDVGVDMVSFGGTKNGMMIGEAVVSLNRDVTYAVEFYRKQSAQLCSKMRYLSAQFIPYIDNNLWLENATKANAAARKLYDVLRGFSEITFTQEVESNQLFLVINGQLIEKLLENYFFYVWNEKKNEIRLVTSWDTTDEDIIRFVEAVMGNL